MSNYRYADWDTCDDDYERGRHLDEVFGLPSDLIAAIRFNATAEFGLAQLRGAKTVLEISGEHDGPQWHWILTLGDGRYAYIHGGCDYTGWDCQSGADVHIGDTTMRSALRLAGDSARREFEEMLLAGEKVRPNRGGI